MGFPDRIERTVELAHPPAKVWAAITTAEGLGTWFGNKATVDLRVGGTAQLTWSGGDKATCGSSGSRRRRVRLHLAHQRPARPTIRAGPTSSSPSSRSARAPGSPSSSPASRSCPTTRTSRRSRATPRAGRASWVNWSTTSMPQLTRRRRRKQVFVALADPSRRGILAALASGGPATATDLAERLPITRQAIAKHLALLAEAGLVIAEPGERRGSATGSSPPHAGGAAVPRRAGPGLGRRLDA